MSQDPYAYGALQAEKLLKELGTAVLPVDPFAIAAGKGITVAAKPPEHAGVSGMLIRVGNEFAIAYSTHLGNEPFQRFSVGHELGHYFLPGHVEAVLDARGVHESRAGYSSKDKFEMEADGFAAGLLMPRYLFFPALQAAGKGFAAIEKLASACGTSLHATAIRYVQCTREPVAIVVSAENRVEHCVMSKALQAIGGIDWLRKREAVPRGTPTFEFSANAENVRRGARADGSSNLQAWFGGRHNVEISEDVVGLGRYGKTLTVLYDIEVPTPEEDEEEDDLVESWTPRFRR